MKPPVGVDEFAFRKMRFEAAVQIIRYLASKPVLNGASLTDEDKAKRQMMCKRAYLWVDELWSASE
jgi:hypothetical protein